MTTNSGSQNLQEQATSDPHQCNLPYFTQELALLDLQIMKQRVQNYLKAPKKQSTIETCFESFKRMDPSKEFDSYSQNVEGGFECPQQTFYFEQKDAVNSNFNIIAEKRFTVKGVGNRPITQFFQVDIGSEFLYNSDIGVLIKQAQPKGITAGGSNSECLLDKSCQISRPTHKNHQTLDVVLTSGEYVIQIITKVDSESHLSQYLSKVLEIKSVPYSLKVQALPIYQSEQRMECPYMFMQPDFIQKKFLDLDLTKFHFRNKIILNLVELKQLIQLKPKVNSQLKIVLHETYGLNAEIKLCQQSDCTVTSNQVGSTEILTTNVQKGQSYEVTICYEDSVIAMHSNFQECPHIMIELSLISNQELETIDKETQKIQYDQQSAEKELQSIYNKLSQLIPFAITDPSKNTYQFKSQTNKEFEVVSQGDFNIKVKSGLYFEVFYSPYQDEVLQISLFKNINAMMPGIEYAKYSAQKSIWVELEPANYTIQILLFRQAQVNKKIETIQYQIYLDYMPVSVSRQALLPTNLNYLGLLGEGLDGHTEGTACLFYDNMALNQYERNITFNLSQKTTFYLKLYQNEQNLKARISQDQKIEGKSSTDVNFLGSTEQTIVAQLQPNIVYTLSLTRSETSTSSLIEDVNGYDETTSKFTLLLNFAVISKQANLREDLPISIDQIQKIRKMVPDGLKESSFYMGTREGVHLFDDLVSINSTESPYEPKNVKLFTGKSQDSKIVLSLPFKVQNEEIIYVGLTDFSLIQSLDVAIYDQESNDEITFSTQGNFYSQISAQTLSAGEYYIVVRSNLQSEMFVQFQIDVKRKIEDEDSGSWQEGIVAAMQMCPGPEGPTAGFNMIGYMHELSGQTLKSDIPLNLLKLSSGTNTLLQIDTQSMVIVYIEVPDDIEAALSISESGGMKRLVALSSDQDQYQTNFIKQKGFTHKRVVELRNIVRPGNYRISAQQVSYSDPNLSFSQKENLCQTFRLFLAIYPVTSSSELDQDQDYCESKQGLPNQLTMHSIQRRDYATDISSMSMEISQFNTNQNNQKGPFLFYFQMDYDMNQEGVVALLLSKFDRDANSFTEIGIYSFVEGQASIFKVIDAGTYVVSIKPIASTLKKFNIFEKSQNSLPSGCFRAKYTYLIDTFAQNDPQPFMNGALNYIMNMFSIQNLDQMEEALIVLETQDNLKNLDNFKPCTFQNLPESWPLSDSGLFEKLTLKVSRNEKDSIIIQIEKDSLVKIFIKSRSLQNQVFAKLIDTSEHKKVINRSNQATGMLQSVVNPQMPTYEVQIIYEKLNENDDCPLFDFIVAVKSLEALAKENLECKSFDLPPEEIKVNQTLYRLDQEYSFSSDFISTYGDEEHGTLQYDIEIKFPHNDYLLDIQLESDFQTSSLSMVLLAKDSQTGRYKRIAISKYHDDQPESYEMVKASTGFKQTLMFIEEIDAEQGLDDSSELLLRLVLGKDTSSLIQTLQKQSTPFCFNFKLSIFANEQRANKENFIKRVEYMPRRFDRLFDTSEKLFLVVEFMHSIRNTVPQLSSIYLANNSTNSDKIFASEVKLRNDNDDVLIVEFKANSLNKGICYELQYSYPFQDSNLAQKFKICTSRCSCDQSGTSKCDEDSLKPTCLCHPNYKGLKCDQCADGYVKQPQSGLCVLQSFCKDKGGQEDCQGHGNCYQIGNFAQCNCDAGFANIGQVQCGRCSDPLFVYPSECDMKRTWILESSSIVCSNLPYNMPKNLSQSQSHTLDEINNGYLHWEGRYSLHSQIASHSKISIKNNESNRSKSSHYFLIFLPSTFRLFLNTPTDYIELNYQIKDPQGKVLYSSIKSDKQFLEFGQLQSDSTESQFELEIEYTTLPFSEQSERENECPILEVNFIVEPLLPHQRDLKCTQQELERAGKLKLPEKISLDNSLIQQFDIVLNSGMEIQKGGVLNDDDINYVYMTIDLDASQSGHILTVFTSYKFSDLWIDMSLLRADGAILSVDQAELLDKVSEIEKITVENDMLSHIQISNMPAGQYKLLLSIPKGFWTYTRMFETCLSFSLTIEYFKKPINLDRVSILAVYPTQRNDLDVTQDFDLFLSTFGDLNTLATSIDKRYQICKLVGTKDPRFKIAAADLVIFSDRQQMTISFSFKTVSQRIQPSDCFNLECENPDTKEQLFLENNSFKYCFSKAKPKCNPLSKFKIENNECICSEPYTGKQCEDCISNSKRQQKYLKGEKHTFCEYSLDESECNGNGVYTKNGKCICDNFHQGDRCQMCSDPTFAYPDCSGDYKKESTSSNVLRVAEKTRRQKVYKQSPQLLSEFLYECKYADFPQTLNQVGFHHEFKTGNFHQNGHYIINHNQDNVIQFRPHTTGRFKILVKQPELYEIQTQTETFDIEIGVYSKNQSQVLVSQNNHAIEFGHLGSQRVDFAVLNLDIDRNLQHQELLIFIRVTNYTESDNSECQVIMFEIEFRSTDTLISTLAVENFKQNQMKIIKIEQEHLLFSQDFEKVNLQGKQYNYIQDYFTVNDNTQVTISLEQKFIDQQTHFPLIEIIATDTEYDDFSYSQNQVGDQPKCLQGCIAIGQRTYNKFILQEQYAKNTVLRIWMITIKSNIPNTDCTSFKLTVAAANINKSPLNLSKDRCPLRPILPTSFNTKGYLGLKSDGQQQQDFNYHETAFINLANNHFSSVFELTKITQLIINGDYVPRLQYEILILKDQQIVAKSIENLEEVKLPSQIKPSIYALLEPGSYQLKIVIIDSSVRQKCDQITLRISMKNQEGQLQKQISVTQNDQLLIGKGSQQSFFTPLFGKGYQIIANQEIQVEDRMGMNLLVSISDSDLVQVALLDTQTNHVRFSTFVSDTTQKLIVQNIPPHKFQLIIYSKMFEGSSQEIQVQSFTTQIDIYNHEETSLTTYWFASDKNRRSVETKTVSRQVLNCLSQSQETPSVLMPNTQYKIMIDSNFGSPQLKYKPNMSQNVLKIQLESGFQIEILLNGKSLKRSVTAFNNIFTELVIDDLKANQEYTIILNSERKSMHEYLWAEECRIVNLIVLAYDSDLLDAICQSQDNSQKELQLMPNSQNSLNVKTLNSMTIVLQDQSDIDIEIELVQSVHTPVIHFQKTQTSKKGTMKNQVKSILEQENNLLVEEETFKHTVMWRFFEVKPGNYSFVLEVPNVHELCQTSTFLVNLKTKSVYSQIHTQFIQKYVSQIESQDAKQSIDSQFPLDLGSHQFLGQEVETYLLYSELLVLNRDKELNYIKIPIESDDTLVRIYIESDELLIEHTFNGEKKGKLVSVSFSKLFAKGDHIVKLVPQIGKSVNQLGQIQITISIASKTIVAQNQVYHAKSLKQCAESSFPLALENQKQYTAQDGQSLYNYPYLRLPQKEYFAGFDMIPTPQVSSTFYFRFNETQRIFFQAGSNFLNNHITLQIGGISKEASTGIKGKQTGNVNTLDTELPAGDYELKISLHSSIVDQCGIYSFRGMLNPISAEVNQQIGMTLLDGISNCPIKGDTLPKIIYPSAARTRNGNEDVVSQDGSFIKFYDNVLIDRYHWNHQTEIEVPQKSVLQVILIGEAIQQFQMQLTSGSMILVEPSRQIITKTSAGQISELSLIWILEPYRIYHSLIQHVRVEQKTEKCDYFDIALSLTTFSYLKQKHACNNDQKHLIDVLPAYIKQSDLPFQLDGVFSVQYPEDYATLLNLQTQDLDANSSLAIDTQIESASGADIQAKLVQVQSLSDFELDLFEQPSDLESSLESLIRLSAQTPLILDIQTAKLQRQLPQTSIKPAQKVLFIIQDRNFPFIMDQVIKAQQNDESFKESFCASVKLNLQITPSQKVLAASSGSIAQALSFEFIGEVTTSNSEITRLGQVTTSAHIYIDNLESLTVENTQKNLEAQLTSNFVLQIISGQQVEIQFEPTSIVYLPTGVTLKFQPNLESIKDQISKSTENWIVKLDYQPKNTDKVQLKLSEKIIKQLAENIISLKPSRSQQVKQEIKAKQQSQDFNTDLEVFDSQKQKIVECKCVHGTCLKGQSACNKCDDGWRGTLCDLPKQTSQVKRKHESEDDEIFKVHKISDQNVNQQYERKKQKDVDDNDNNYSVRQHRETRNGREKQNSQKTYKETQWQKPIDDQQISTFQKFIVEPIEWIFSIFIRAVIMVLILVGLSWLGRSTLSKVAQARRLRKKPKRDNNDAQDLNGSNDDERTPLELNVINRKNRSKDQSNFQESDDEKIELTLFDQEESIEQSKQQKKFVQSRIGINLEESVVQDAEVGGLSNENQDELGGDEFEQFI